MIDYSQIFWNDKDCIILLFENLDKKTELIKLKEESNYKDTVLSNVSHEFRTPLNCITFMLQSLKEQLSEIGNDIIEDFIEPALGSARMLLFQVNDLLDNAQIINGKFNISLMENNLFELGKEIVKMFEFIAKTKNLEILFEYDENLPNFVKTDAQRLRQIITNLIGNSLKFTKEGSITLKFEKENEEKIKISVTDTGIGISEANQLRLFNEFSKINNEQSSKMNPHGIGLGLVISNKLVKALNSDENEKINVFSEENKGSTFYFYHKYIKKQIDEEKLSCEIDFIEDFELNCEPNNNKSYVFPNLKLKENYKECLNFEKNKKFLFLEKIKSKEKKCSIEKFDSLISFDLPVNMKSDINLKFSNDINESIKSTSLAYNKIQKQKSVYDIFLKYNLLAVDDNGMNLLVLKQMAKKLQINIFTATDGEECLKSLEKKPNFFDIIIMDCEMPVMDGFEATKIIKNKVNNLEIKDIPIIACTGYSSEEEKKKCLNVGMNEVLVKPITLNQFERVLAKYLLKKKN